MEKLMQLKNSLRKNMEKLILDKRSIDLRFEGNMDVNRLLKKLKAIEAKLNAAESTLHSGSSLDQGLEERVKPVLSLLKSILQENDQIKGKAILKEEIKEKHENFLEPLFNLLEELEEPMERDQAIEEPPNKWTLFKNRVLEEKEFNNQIMLEIATELFNEYHHNPTLLEEIVALFSLKQTPKEWEACHDNVLKTFRGTSKTTLFDLKLNNYEQLDTNIQKCLCYCSLFPKDYTFNKTDLIHLWASQEYLSAKQATNPEFVCDEYFEKLLKKGYFFESILDGYDGTGDILGYKMHYLVNEFVKEKAKPKFCLIDEPTREIDVANILHLSFIVDSSWKAPSQMFTAKNLLSLLFIPRKFHEDFVDVSDMNTIFTSLTCLRALDLAVVNCENIPSSFGELKDLRYLRFGLALEIPESIFRLENLQTLDLRHSDVMVTPSEFCTFRHLRHLYFGSRLVDDTSKVWDLDSYSLRTLEVCVVSQNYDWLDASNWLKDQDDIGRLIIRFEKKNMKDRLSEHKGETYDGDSMQPSPIPYCLFSENLVSICIEACRSCKSLPNFSRLPYLRSLQIWDLIALEYIENNEDDNGRDSDLYFPSLKYLMLANLQELKGWSSSSQKQQPLRCNHFQLRIKGCPELESMPPIPNLESLQAYNIDIALLKYLIISTQKESSPRNLDIVSVSEFDSTFSFNNSFNSLTIRLCPKLKKLNFTNDMTSIQQLVIHDCTGLNDIASALQQLSALQKLEIKRCEELKLGDEKMIVAWEGLQSLHSLKLIGISNLASLENGLIALQKLEVLSLNSFYELKALPEWIGKLTQIRRLLIGNCPYLITLPDSLGDLSALQQLEIQYCRLLKRIPNSFARLKSLHQLKIQQCPKLFTRCQRRGEDFPLIQQITDIVVLE